MNSEQQPVTRARHKWHFCTLAATAAVATLVAGGAAVAGTPSRAVAASPAPAAAVRTLPGDWKLLPAAPVTKLPDATTSVWAGQEMFIHGLRYTATSGIGRDAFAYRPAANDWATLPRGPKPLTAEGGDVTLWTGKQVLVIGLTSAAYDPASNTWRSIARFGGPASQIAGWTGHEAVVWNGTCCGGSARTGAAYDPATNTWRGLPVSPLAPRVGAMGGWTGKELIVAGGENFRRTGGTEVFRGAAAYNPATNKWRRLAPMIAKRWRATTVWDGKELLFLGGSQVGTNGPAGRGLAYNPRTNQWRRLPRMAFPRTGFAAVWDGRQVLVWGGMTGAGIAPPHGEAYSPAGDQWLALPPSPLRGRNVATAVWTGHQMIVWGGYVTANGRVTDFLDGAVFTPHTN